MSSSRTVGIDIGSSTSHLLFAKVRAAAPVAGAVQPLHRGRPRGGVALADHADAVPARRHDRRARGSAISSTTPIARPGFSRADDRQRRRDPHRRGDQADATRARSTSCSPREAGKFVCATAGHRLEGTARGARLGRGAAVARQRGDCVLHVDIGGGTTKLALIDQRHDPRRRRLRGRRPAARDRRDGRWTRVDDSARLVAAELGLATDPQALADPERAAADRAPPRRDRRRPHPRRAARRARRVAAAHRGRCRAPVAPDGADVLGRRRPNTSSATRTRDYGDIARSLAAALGARARPRAPRCR